MKRILLVKLTSMGDLIQMLPALTDATNAIPGIQFDWLCEDSFKEVARLHPAVQNVITLPYRRWKKNKMLAIKSGEISQFLKQLRSQRYDMVIDTQSNLKSGFVSSLAKGRRYGVDSRSVREYGAHWFYHQTITVSRLQNHAERMRQIMAAFLSYECPVTPANYGIQLDKLPVLNFPLPEHFIFLIPFASFSNKLWPEPYWQAVIESLIESGHEIVLSWYGKKEYEFVLRLKGNRPEIHILPELTLTQKTSILSRATAAISVDTGLAHMAAALNIPNVCLYGSSNPLGCGTVGKQQIHLTATSPACAPCSKTYCKYEGSSEYQPACLGTITPQQVLHSFYSNLGNVPKVFLQSSPS